MTIVLLCAYREREESEKALFFDHIDTRIRELRRMGLNVICVLGGAQADDQLRYCRRIAECELVFDTNDQPNLATNLKAGLAGTDGSGCFAMPVEVPCPSREAFALLREEWRTRGFHTGTHVYRLVDEVGAPSQSAPYGFPLLVTRSGNSSIKKMTGFRGLLDARLVYAEVSDSSHAGLASLELPL